MPASSGRTTIAVAICTYKRNEPLAVLLESLIACAERVRERAAVGVVIVDDTQDEQARPVAEAFAGRFELGLQLQGVGQAEHLDGAQPGDRNRHGPGRLDSDDR